MGKKLAAMQSRAGSGNWGNLSKCWVVFGTSYPFSFKVVIETVDLKYFCKRQVVYIIKYLHVSPLPFFFFFTSPLDINVFQELKACVVRYLTMTIFSEAVIYNSRYFQFFLDCNEALFSVSCPTAFRVLIFMFKRHAGVVALSWQFNFEFDYVVLWLI